MKRDFGLIVYGATGCAGRRIAEYLATFYRGDDAPRWAIAGRSTDKLQKVRANIGAPDDFLLVKAYAAEPASLRSMCERAAVIITAVGPYQLHGPELVAACAATGTAYVDLCGEPAWMRRMIDAHHEEAKRTGARIVFACGFFMSKSHRGSRHRLAIIWRRSRRDCIFGHLFWIDGREQA